MFTFVELSPCALVALSCFLDARADLAQLAPLRAKAPMLGVVGALARQARARACLVRLQVEDRALIRTTLADMLVWAELTQANDPRESCPVHPDGCSAIDGLQALFTYLSAGSVAQA